MNSEPMNTMRRIFFKLRRNVLLCAAFAALFLVVWIYRQHGNFLEILFDLQRNYRKNDEPRYEIKLDNCKTPRFEYTSDEYNKSYKHWQYWTKEMQEICNTFPDFSKLENNNVFLTNQHFTNCCISSITRRHYDPKDHYVLSDTCKPVRDGEMDVSDLEFLMVKCETRHGPNQSFAYNFHANVPVNTHLKPKIDFWKSQSPERPYSIFVLVIDSTSRAEFFRSLPKTADQLLNNMHFTDFNGHHPLGEPTQFNVMPMLMGIDRRTFQQRYFRFNDKQFWNSAPFIWNAFNQLRYITGYFEDDPSVGTFNYGGQLGFEEQPTSLYIRPLMILHSKMVKRNGYKGYCFGERNVIEFLLDYHFKTLVVLSEVPTFQITWPCWPQHDLAGGLKVLDQNYTTFFNRISRNKQILENTLFVVTSDHGFYMNQNKYPNSYEGLLERRNLPLFVRLPDRLRRNNPGMQQSLEWNSKLITSHYDLYQMFSQIAGMRAKVEPLTNLTTYGISLLEKIPENRTCEEARIPRTMCLCNLATDSNYAFFKSNDVNIDRKDFDAFE